jgi:hypothetical protein
MFWYIYYSYLAYNAYKYSYILEYGYYTVHYAGKVYTWFVPAKENGEIAVDKDWVLCGVEDASEKDLNVLVLD